MVAAVTGPHIRSQSAQWQERFTLALERLAGNQVAVLWSELQFGRQCADGLQCRGGKPTVFIWGNNNGTAKGIVAYKLHHEDKSWHAITPFKTDF
jgi:hypothetical protein